MIRDKRPYEVQIIDAVRSVNKALGGTYGTSPAIYKSEYNQYEVQLIDAIKGIGRTLSGSGLSLAGGGVASGDLSSLQERLSKLERESFFRLVGGNVTLKERYENLWVPGWLAAGGVGSGGGGGGTYTAGEGIDITDGVISLAIASASTLGGVKVGTGLDIDEYGNLYVTGGGGGGSTVSISGLKSTGMSIATITIDGVAKTIKDGLTWGTYDDTDKTVTLTLNNQQYTLCVDGYGGGGGGDYLPITGGTLTGDLRLKPTNANYGSKIRFGDGDYVYLYENTDDHLTIYADKGITLSTGSGYGIEIGNAKLIYDSDNNALRLTNKNGAQSGVSFYADGWVSAGGVGSGGGGGGSTVVVNQILTSGTAIASISVDGVSTTLYAPSGGGGGGISLSDVWGSLTTATDAYATSKINAAHIPDQSGTYVTLSTQQNNISGAKTFTTNDVTLSSVSLVPAANNTCGVGSSTKRFANIYGVKGDLSGNMTFGSSAVLSYSPTNYALELSGVDSTDSSKYVGFSVSGDSFIDIGDARLVYDSGAQALHVTYKSGTGRTIGLFADGFVSAGGTAAQSSVRFVTVDGGDQSISGEKIFSDYTEFASAVQLTGENVTSGPTLSVYGMSTFENVNITGSLTGVPYVKYVNCTQAQYNAISPKDNTTLYIIGAPSISKVYLGSILIFTEN